MLTTTISTLVLIFLAEIGDKSQLVCMLLASRHRALPVFAGTITAFAILNLLAVLVGASLAQAIPLLPLKITVALLFIFFGVQNLRDSAGDTDEDIEEKSGHNVFITAFLMIFMAELGDKTQLAVAGLSTSAEPLAIFIGATLALALTTLLGIIGGRWITRKISVALLRKIAGVLFIVAGAWVGASLFL